MTRSSNTERQEIFSPPKCPDQLWGTPSLLFNGWQGTILVVKRPGPTTEVKNKWSHTNPPICLHDMDRGSFTSPLPTGSVKEEFNLVLSKKYITNCCNRVSLNPCCRIYCYVRLYMLLLTLSLAFSLVFIDILHIYIITNHTIRFCIIQLVQIPSEIFINWLNLCFRSTIQG